MVASATVTLVRRRPWIGTLSRRALAAAGLAYLMLFSAIVAGAVGGQRIGASAAGFVAVLCTHDGGAATAPLPGEPAPAHHGHGICALCIATGCVAGLAAPPAMVAATEIRVAAPPPPSRRELRVRPPVKWRARSRAPPAAA